MLAALENAPELDMQRRFLIGYAAAEGGNLDVAVSEFRKILESQPGQTRVRLELARALMLQGKTGAADYHFKLAQGARDIPPEIAATIKASRRLLRDSREFAFNVDVGFAPDSNITNGTSAESVDIAFGDTTLPLTLDEQARKKSGIGQTVGLAATARLALGEETRLLVEANGNLVNYKGKAVDDFFGQIAVGPEFKLSEDTRLSVQAVGNQRYYGGKNAMRGGGLRTSLTHIFGDDTRAGLAIDARRNESGLNPGNSGWQLGATATAERVIGKSAIASAAAFARRDLLKLAAYSGKEFGVNLGVGAELPLGLVGGISGGVSRATYDAPLALFGNAARKDWRFNGRVQLGLRSLRLMGFSPSVTYNFSKVQSNLTLYKTQRHRVQFAVARYF
jgi:outer membrane protein